MRVFSLLIIFSAAVYVWPRIDQRYGDYSEKDFLATRKLIDKYIPQDARVTVEDPTPAIQLYRVGRFGWRFSNNSDAELLLEQRREGAQYVIAYSRQNQLNSLKETLTIVYEGEPFTIYKFIND